MSSRPRVRCTARRLLVRAAALAACALGGGVSPACARPARAPDAPPTALTRQATEQRAARAGDAPPPAPVAVGGASAVAARGGGQRAGSLAGPDGVPRLDEATARHVRELHARGRAMGARPNVFAKLGDSITESGSFLQDIGHGWYELGPYAALADTIAFFHATPVDDEGNDSFAHGSAAATAGWTAADAIAPPRPSPVERELAALRPAIALIMFGTNDLDRDPSPDGFAQNLTRVIELCEARGVVPVLSTIPARLDTPTAAARVAAYNARIEALARARALPLMDLHAALAPLPRHGLSDDGIHPSAFSDQGDTRAGVFTPAALAHGYNARNLLALRTLARLRELLASTR